MLSDEGLKELLVHSTTVLLDPCPVTLLLVVR